MNSTPKNAIYMRSEWVDAPTGAPLEGFLSADELENILCVLGSELRHKEIEKSHPHLRSGYDKLHYFAERNEFDEDY